MELRAKLQNLRKAFFLKKHGRILMDFAILLVSHFESCSLHIQISSVKARLPFCVSSSFCVCDAAPETSLFNETP